MPLRARAPLPLPKQLFVKMKVINRLNKEIRHYRTETQKEQDAIDAAKAAGKDAHDIKQMENCMQETISMVPNAESRFKQSLEDLFSFLQENGSDPTVQEAEDFVSATTMLEENGMPLEVEGVDDGGAEDYADGEIF